MLKSFTWKCSTNASGLKALNLYLNAIIFVKEIPDTEKNLNGKYIYVDKEK